MVAYSDFLESKLRSVGGCGFEPHVIHGWLFDFQKSLVEWALVKGRAAIFADCGLGKTPMQLSWSENVTRQTNKPVLILCPLAVSYQTVAEAEKFGVSADISRDGHVSDAGCIITNYERMEKFDSARFGGVVCDESSILKNFDGATRKRVTDFLKTIPYRLCCTATAAPNDYWELGTTSEALGYLGHRDMLTKFFKQDNVGRGDLGWGKATYRFRGHSQEPFFRWVTSWARACRKPSDVGDYSDEDFNLPLLNETQETVIASRNRDGFLFAVPAKGLNEQREERRISIEDRCNRVAEICDEVSGPFVAWCHLNAEGDTLSKMLDCPQVKGSMKDEQKEELLRAFQVGEIDKLVTKPKIGCFGLNWQHCSDVATFTSHSYEQYYQLVRRCWRFGQKKAVNVSVVSTEGEVGVLANLKRKADQASQMFDSLIGHMDDSMEVGRVLCDHNRKGVIPTWLS